MIANNDAGYGGGIYINGLHSKIDGCTIWNNSASIAGGGVSISSSVGIGSALITNSIPKLKKNILKMVI